jgi:enolase-phosphatase E1
MRSTRRNRSSKREQAIVTNQSLSGVQQHANQSQRSARCVLLDIEGTVADVRFVYEVMFPFVRREVASYLKHHWDDSGLHETLVNLASESGWTDLEDLWEQKGRGRDHAIAQGVDAVHRLMDQDSKTTGLKALQGQIWETGFQSGALRSELFSDVLPALQRWQAAGIELRIYSSGSILAQRLFFGHTTQGDLTPMFTAHYDTTIGPKKEPASYRRIAEDCKLSASDILFLSDVAAELVAADHIGMQTLACVRPNNAPLPDDYSGPTLDRFDLLEVTLPADPREIAKAPDAARSVADC